MSNDQIPDVYVRNGSVYCSRINTIKSGKIIGERCLGYIMPRSRSVDINDELDFEFAEFLYMRGFGSN